MFSRRNVHENKCFVEKMSNGCISLGTWAKGSLTQKYLFWNKWSVLVIIVPITTKYGFIETNSSDTVSNQISR